MLPLIDRTARSQRRPDVVPSAADWLNRSIAESRTAGECRIYVVLEAGKMPTVPLDLAIDPERLAELCRRYHVAKLELFGSRAKGTARPDSDVDLLVTFEAGQAPGIEFFGLANELEALFGRRVDLLTRPRVERDDNSIFRESVLSTATILYAA